jgi:hypothetical protein
MITDGCENESFSGNMEPTTLNPMDSPGMTEQEVLSPNTPLNVSDFVSNQE